MPWARQASDCMGLPGQLDNLLYVYFAFADQMKKVVECKHKCKAKLSKLDVKPVKDILANIYHHLQYSYCKGRATFSFTSLSCANSLVLVKVTKS